MRKRFAFKAWNLDAYLDLQNAYNRRNVCSKFWDDGQEQTVHDLPLGPFLGIQAAF